MVHCTVPGQHLPPKEDKQDALEAVQFTHAQAACIASLSPKKWFKFSPHVHLCHLSEVSGVARVTPYNHCNWALSQKQQLIHRTGKMESKMSESANSQFIGFDLPKVAVGEV